MFVDGNKSYCGLAQNELRKSKEDINTALKVLPKFRGCKEGGYTETERSAEEFQKLEQSPGKPKDDLIKPGKVHGV
jgi:hypothetical protein